MNTSQRENSKSAFEHLHPKVQQELYRMRWTELRPIQVKAINTTFCSDNHMIVSAKTASGKTEAAFLPIISKIVEDTKPGLQALYVGPLKALINDQFRRLEELCEKAEIPVHRWHGDVTQSAKKNMLSNPNGILLITPESLESMFVNRSGKLNELFSNLDFIVIDEMHSFIGQERGAHLKSLISRLRQRNKQTIRIFGLSATIGDMALAANWMLPNEGDLVSLVDDADEAKALKYRIQCYLNPKKENENEEEEEYNISIIGDIYHTFKNKTSLVFGNSKSELEKYVDRVKQFAKDIGSEHHFGIHHGSLSKSNREDAEEVLKSGRPITVFCSSTLEMGIDIGNISIVGQLNSPWSVSSLAQRIGRSGRGEDEPSIMKLFVLEDEPDEKNRLFEHLYRNFLQALAMSELMIDKWCEPPEVNRMHLSTLIQQTMSIVIEYGGASVNTLKDSLISNGIFLNVVDEVYDKILTCLIDKDILEMVPEGVYILGLKGEKIASHFDFYVAFNTYEEFRVVYEGKTVGSISQPASLQIDSYLILAGRRWKILDINMDRKEILVTSSRAGRAPKFQPSLGSDIHLKVRQRMHDLLFESREIGYLDNVSSKMLTHSREIAVASNIKGKPFIQEGADVMWFTWTGSRINRTLAGLAVFYGKFKVCDEDICLLFEKEGLANVKDFFQSIRLSPPTEYELASTFINKTREKYDHFLSEELQTLQFAQNSLDLEGALTLLDEVFNPRDNRE